MTAEAPGWVYRHFEWTQGDGDFEAWVRGMRDEGWQVWAAGSGAWFTKGGRRVFGLSVRKPFDRPYAAPPR